MTLDLSWKPRGPSGLRSRDNQYDSIHGGHLRSQGKSQDRDIDVLAPPQDSSDEASKSDNISELPSDGSSNGNRKRKRICAASIMNKKAQDSIIPKRAGTESRSQIAQEPSTIHPSMFIAADTPQIHGGSQGSQKRRRDVTREEEDDLFGMGMGMTSSQRRGVKNSYSGNIHTLPASQGKKVTSSAPSHNSQTTRSGFHVADTKALHTQVDRRASLDAESGEITSKNLSSTESSPRFRKASQTSSKSSRDSSQCSQKPTFKAARRLSPKKASIAKQEVRPVFKSIPNGTNGTDSRRTTRSSGNSKEPLALGDPNTGSKRFLRHAADIVADKLGLPDLDVQHPSSSIERSSAPSIALNQLNTSSPLSSAPEEVIVDADKDGSRHITSEIKADNYEKQGPPICPFCKAPVPPMLLKEKIKPGERLTIRKQAQFCRSHKKEAAEEEWRHNGYPMIDWPNFSGWLDQYHTILDDILQNRRPSFYRNAFEDVVKSGKNWTWQQDVMSGNMIEELSPGYYGSRGAKLMMENIMAKFAGKLRRLANIDNLISTGGVSGFVQAVLVPELAVMLVQADMSIDDEEKAREVLRSSVAIGHLLNEEEDELIQDPDLEDVQDKGDI